MKNQTRIFLCHLLLSAVCLVSTGIAEGQAPTKPPISSGRAELNQALNTEAASFTAARRVELNRITTFAAARKRQILVRKTILRLIGGLPERTPLHAEVLGNTDFSGFHIEKVIFESQPGFYVTALLYLPSAGRKGQKYPAILMAPGHGAHGKASDFPIASAFAQNGFVVLSYDPIGQGERLQYPDPEKPGTSLAIRPTGEHGEAGLQPTLIGDAIARYFVWDAMRAVDYLATRPEVNSKRIGALGCSGGGAMTAMTAALDPRIAAVAVACYNTSFDALLSSIGPQDAEQSIAGFIAAGLDFPDWIELVAPRPYAAAATYSDMFPFEGARATMQEARRFYNLFDRAAGGVLNESLGAAPGAIPGGVALNVDTANKVTPSSPLQFITGPGGHGALAPVLPEILRFFKRNLEVVSDPSMVAPSPTTIGEGDLLVTKSGQVATSYPNAKTVFSLNQERAMKINKCRALRGVELAAAVRSATAARLYPGQSVFDRILLQSQDGSITIPIEDGEVLRGTIAVPAIPGSHPAVLLLVPDSMDDDSVSSKRYRAEVKQLTGAGNVVLALTPRPSFPGLEETKAPSLGTFYLLSLRAELVGRTLLGIRIDDAIRAVDYLAKRPDVDPSRIEGIGDGHMGLVLLHAALLDPRLRHVSVSGGLSSYQKLLDTPFPSDAPEDIVPGVLRSYDIPDIVTTLDSRVSWASQ
jgi:cephalosporin-C deacetylase-like acetyl esterase